MNNCKQDLEVALIEYMFQLMWGIAPFWDDVHLTCHQMSIR